MRLIDADAINYDDYWQCKGYTARDCQQAEKLISEQPTVEPTLYGYKIEHLALIAWVMQKNDISAERAVQIFNDIQKITMKIIDEINETFERTLKQLTETKGSENDTVD